MKVYEELIKAVEEILKDGRFMPYNKSIFSTSRQYELHLNNVLLEYLGSTYSRNSVKPYGRRKFDLKIIDPNMGELMVCEIGHEKSSRGYLYKANGKPNNMGLINKLFFDYIKNYRYEGLSPLSYAFLYFSVEKSAIRPLVEQLIDTIINLYPTHHATHSFYVFHNEELTGKILVIDQLSNIDQVRNLYKSNPQIWKFVKPNERGWEKEKILMGIKDPWS